MACFLFYGEDLYSLREKVRFWKEEFMKKHGGEMNLEVLDGKMLTVDQLRNAVSTVPFLGEKRLVVIKNLILEGDKEVQKDISEFVYAERGAKTEGGRTARQSGGRDDGELIEDFKPVKKTVDADSVKAASAIPDFCIVVFMEEGMPDQRLSFFKKLQKYAKVEEFKLKTGGALIAWIFKICKKFNVEIEQEAAIYLSELTGGDLYRLENEIHKLAHYALTRPISRSDIELLVDAKLDTSIFRLTDALGNSDQKLSLAILHQLIESGEDLHRTLYMIIRQFRIITQVKDLMDQGLRKAAIAAKINEHPFVCGIAMVQAQNFSLEKLKKIYESLLAIDTKLKTGRIKMLAGDDREFVLAVDKFMVDLCARQ